MPRVPVDVTNSVGLAETTGARFQAADSQAGEIVGKAVQGLGEQGKVAAEQQFEYQQKALALEANKYELTHIEATRDISETVANARGDQAGGVALQATTDLNSRTKAIIAAASPRARPLLAQRLAERNAVTITNFREHARRETDTALADSSKAIIKQASDDAVREPDDSNVGAVLTPAFTQNEQLAAQLGWSADTLKSENRKVVSDVIESRAHQMGQSDSAAAIAYAAKHRAELGEAGFTRITDTYIHAARGEEAKSYHDAHPEILQGTIAAPVSTDPLAPLSSSGGKLTPEQAWAFTAKHEGGYAAHDANGAPVNFGINQSANPGVDVKSMTKEQAGQIFKQKYWDKSGAADLPAALAAVHSDTYFINPAKASSFLKQSGGDAQKYMDLREGWMRSMVAKDPGKFGKYARAWTSRNADLRAMAGGTAPGSQAPSMAGQPAVTASIADVDARIDAIPNMSYEAKEALRVEARSRISEAHQARGQLEEDAGRQAMSVVAKLDKNFTSMTQIPGHVLSSLAPATFMALGSRADSNKQGLENTPATPQMETLVSFTRLANPELCSSPKFLEQLHNMGAPASMLRQVGAEQGAVAGAIVNQKPDPISASEVWTVAKPAFEASGIFLDHQESTGKANQIKERQADAIRKEKAVGFLRDVATTWARQNPGQKPDQSLIKGWVGQALRAAPGGARIFDGDPHQIVSAFTPQMLSTARQALGKHGVPATEGNIYSWYKAMVAMHPIAQDAIPANTGAPRPPRPMPPKAAPRDALAHTKAALWDMTDMGSEIFPFNIAHQLTPR